MRKTTLEKIFQTWLGIGARPLCLSGLEKAFLAGQVYFYGYWTIARF